MCLLLAGTVPGCGSTIPGDAMRGGSSGSGGLGQAGAVQGVAGSGQGGAGWGNAGSGGVVGGSAGAANSGTNSGGAAGAGGGSAGSGGGHSSATLSELTNSYCTAVRGCCQKAGFGGDQLADCETRYPEIYGLDLVEAGSVVVDQAALAACLDTLQQLATSCVGLPYNACQKALKGTRATGESCTDLSECVTGTEPVACMILGSDTSGHCQPIPRGALGDTCVSDCFEGGSCSFTSQGGADPVPPALCYSEDNLFCDITQDIPKCTSTFAMGAECGSDWQCGADGYCDYQAEPMLCKSRKQVGAPCRYSSECSKRDDLYCEDKVCALQPFFSSDSRCDGTSF